LIRRDIEIVQGETLRLDLAVTDKNGEVDISHSTLTLKTGPHDEISLVATVDDGPHGLAHVTIPGSATLGIGTLAMAVAWPFRVLLDPADEPVITAGALTILPPLTANLSPRVSVYASPADLLAYLREGRLGELSNEDGDKGFATQKVQTFLNEQLWRTERVVHGLIGAPYRCPQDEKTSPHAFAAISEGILAMTVHRLFVRGLIAGTAGADLKGASDKAVEYFEAIHSGDGQLPSDAIPTAAKAVVGSSSSYFGSEPKMFGDPEAA
jgi:hypothetical protein